MMVARHMLRPLLAATLLAAGAPAAAQCQLCAAPAAADKGPTAAPLELFPLTVTITTELDFSRMVIASSSAGTARLDANTGARSVSGGLTALGGMPVRGTVTVTGFPLRRLVVTMPRRVVLTSTNGNTAELTDIVSTEGSAPRLSLFGQLTFNFGGTLRVGAGDAGDFRGRIPIDVDYE